MTESRRALPRAGETLVVSVVGEESLVYDLRSHRAHCLNRTCALVWERCDGRSGPADAAEALTRELGLPYDEGIVWAAVEKLAEAGLVERGAGTPAGVDTSRRSALRRIAAIGGSAVLLPMVTSIVAPTAVSAQSGGLVAGDTCASGPQCMAGLVCCRDDFGGTQTCQTAQDCSDAGGTPI
jgi:hypothetical protein